MTRSTKNKDKKDKGLLKELFGIEGDPNSPEYLFKDMLDIKRAVESYAHEVGTTTEQKKKKRRTKRK